MAEQSVKDPIKEVNAENWMPLESNPEILNAYLEALGFETIKYKIQELYSHEEWA
jgi:ubiquitin carboxyl-terminal hydrolase L3